MNVFWNETAFPLCSATHSCWNRKVDSLTSPVMLAIHLPISRTIIIIIIIIIRLTCPRKTVTRSHAQQLSEIVSHSCAAASVRGLASAIPCVAEVFVSQSLQVSHDAVVSSESFSPLSDYPQILPPPFVAPNQPCNTQSSTG